MLRELTHLLRPHWLRTLVAALLGAGGGFAVTGLLATVNNALSQGGDMAGAALTAFVAFCALTLLGSALSDVMINRSGQRIVADLRQQLSAIALSSPLDRLERYRAHKVLTTLTRDIDAISVFAYNLSSLAVSASITLGCLAYLAWLSWPLFAIAGVAIALGSVAQYVARQRGIAGFGEVRAQEDGLQKAFATLTSGAKELKISRPRRHKTYREGIVETSEKIASIQLRATYGFIVAKTIGSALFFALIGVILVASPAFVSNPDVGMLSGFVLVLLFLRSPIDQLMATLPSLGRAQVAVKRIGEFRQELSAREAGLLDERAPVEAKAPRAIALRDASYSFIADDGSVSFRLGPLDIDVRAGEILFIVGPNGSGKTTLIKMLLGLYPLASGVIARDGAAVTDEDRDAYRQNFSTVFSDFHLFEALANKDVLPAAAAPYLERLELADKLSLKDGVFSTTDLSTGQRKRLALVHAYLEDRPFIVFDEWAADQDPFFRRVFYEELLPDMKRQGKTVIVISHDDRYFGAADRIAHIDGGRIVEIQSGQARLVDRYA